LESGCVYRLFWFGGVGVRLYRDHWASDDNHERDAGSSADEYDDNYYSLKSPLGRNMTVFEVKFNVNF